VIKLFNCFFSDFNTDSVDCWDPIPLDEPRLGAFECFEDDLLLKNSTQHPSLSCLHTSSTADRSLYASQLIHLWNHNSHESFQIVEEQKREEESIGAASSRSVVYDGEAP